MIHIGKYNKLKVLRFTSVGIYLGDEEGEDVLLPNKYCPDNLKVDDEFEVFVYLDSEERKIATNLTPKINLGEFAFLQVSAKTSVGVFLDWGLEKELMVPYSEQRLKMEEGRWYVVYLNIDTKTNRLYASNKIDKFIEKDQIDLKLGEKVNLLISNKTDLGYEAIINNKYKGLLYSNEVFQKLDIGNQLQGFVKQVREDKKIDLSLYPAGYDESINLNTKLIIDKLNENKGYLPVSDKASPEEIYKQFSISKKAFKKAVGSLYKSGLILITDEGIRLINEHE